MLWNCLAAPGMFLPVLIMVAAVLSSTTASGWDACLYFYICLFIHITLSIQSSQSSKQTPGPLINSGKTNNLPTEAHWQVKVFCVTEQVTQTDSCKVRNTSHLFSLLSLLSHIYTSLHPIHFVTPYFMIDMLLPAKFLNDENKYNRAFNTSL